MRAAKAFLPQVEHTMDALYFREKIQLYHVFTHMPSAGDCFCLSLSSGHTHSCDFPVIFPPRMTLMFTHPTDGSLDTLLATV